jgi:actin-related protein
LQLKSPLLLLHYFCANSQDMRAQLPNSLVPSLCQLPEYMAVQSPQYVPWVGGAVMAKLVAHQGHFMIKAEYEEVGPSAVHRKCA